MLIIECGVVEKLLRRSSILLCLLWTLLLDPHLKHAPIKYRCLIKKRNRITPAYLNFIGVQTLWCWSEAHCERGASSRKQTSCRLRSEYSQHLLSPIFFLKRANMYMYIYSFKHIAYPTYNSMNFNLFFIPSWIWVELPNALGQISKLFRRFDDNFFFHLGHLDFQKNRFNYCQYDLLSSYGIIEWEIFWKSINP